jgi:hypothetical protein
MRPASRPAALAGAAPSAAGTTPRPPAAAACGADLSVVIRDGGRPTAAAVRLYDSQGRLVVPDNALELGGLGYLYKAGALIHYADWTSTRVRSEDPFFGSSYFRAQHPPGTACFFVDGGFRVSVSPGRYSLTVSKGLEYVPLERTFDLQGDRSETVDLERWVDMARSGWYSGDDHVHIERTGPAADRAALLWMAAEDVRVANVLLMGDARETYYRQYGWTPVARDGRALIPGQEDPRTRQLGHTLHLGISGPVRDASRYYDYVPVFERIARAGGLNGFAHVGRRRWHFEVDRALSLAAPLQQEDFVEIAQMGYIGVNLWYEFLNLGFRITAMAGSDVPWGGTIGCARVYALTGKPFSAAGWLDAVKRGRTFVTTGPMLNFTVNGNPPGSVLRVKKGAVLRVHAGVTSRGPVRTSIVALGKPLHEGAGNFEVRAERSMWITAVCQTNQQPLMDAPGFFSGAVATPVYVEVDGAPVRDTEHLDQLVTARLKALDAIESLESGGDGGAGGWESADALRASLPALREQVARARAWYLGLRKVGR